MNANQVLHHRPTAQPRAVVRRAAAVLLIIGAWLACAPRGSAQGHLTAPELLNEEEIQREIAVRHPAALRDRGHKGSADLRFRVLADGTVDTATVTVEDATHPAFAAAAVQITRTMRFAPARLGDTAVAAWYHYSVDFPLGVANGPTDGTYMLSEVEAPPRLLNGSWAAREISARYPPERRDAGISGDVRVRFKVNETGAVDSLSVQAVASTDTAFETPAVTVIRWMRFTPARIGRRHVSVYVSIPVGFRLEEDPPEDSAATTRQPSVAPPAAPGQPSSPIASRVGPGPFAGSRLSTERVRQRVRDEHARHTEART